MAKLAHRLSVFIMLVALGALATSESWDGFVISLAGGSTGIALGSFVTHEWAWRRFVERTASRDTDEQPANDGATSRFPRFDVAWELFGYLLSPTLRDRVYKPQVAELSTDLKRARRRKGRRVRAWLVTCLSLRTAFLFADVLIVGFRGWTAKRLPPSVRLFLEHWWQSRF